MNVEELDSIVRDELRRDAANTPSGGAVRAAVLAAVSGLPAADRPARRWAIPLLVAAAVVALAVAATLLPRAFDKHSQPANPKPPSLPPAPSLYLDCAKTEQQVSGAGTRYTDTAGDLWYAYEYYCAKPDGSRTGSEIDAFRMVGGRLVFDHQLLPRGQQYVMSMTGTDGGMLIREYDASPGINGQPGGTVSDARYQLDPENFTAVSTVIAQPCLATDLTVRWNQANEPTSHPVLQLTNRSGKPCAVWGNPHYTQIAGQQRATIRSVLRGPAGGLAAGAASAPPLLLQPGESAYSAVGTDPVADHCFVPTVSVALANGVRLGSHSSACAVVSYPLVRATNGSEDHPESEAPALSVTGSCGITDNDVNFDMAPIRSVPGGRVGMVLTVAAHGSGTCTIGGFPNVRALDAGGSLLEIADQRPLTGLPTGQVTVSPGHPASMLIDWTRAASGSCFPNGHLDLTLGGGGYEFGQLMGRFCDLRVHQFVAGSTGSG